MKVWLDYYVYKPHSYLFLKRKIPELESFERTGNLFFIAKLHRPENFPTQGLILVFFTLSTKIYKLHKGIVFFENFQLVQNI